MQIMANIYCLFILGVIAFQIALIIGAPWGRITQGGQHEGALPLKGRLAAAISVVLLLVMALAILSAAGGWPAWPKWIGWAAAALNGVVMALNWATPSSAERKLWGRSPAVCSRWHLPLSCSPEELRGRERRWISNPNRVGRGALQSYFQEPKWIQTARWLCQTNVT